ncbi:hypothetical protein IBT49_14260 [Erwinia sp. S63]|uniref:hypothetical protein n=1 Tax=Erwinia sp. S63 TaxID=2769341 RepID=UPI0019092556|nr:hypothetical protein [Erwinia sp. S63]MBK0097145.1 hypothetical protein [Erwinia sp. S63]
MELKYFVYLAAVIAFGIWFTFIHNRLIVVSCALFFLALLSSFAASLLHISLWIIIPVYSVLWLAGVCSFKYNANHTAKIFLLMLFMCATSLIAFIFS